ncbi:hypothetical protein HU200_044433 [Digitaria exilis]|uniref:Uncharacterized protein n=1 Tax=Digitaria exilis TaxID=1010633 RepID=A0A835B0U5_9POAL|nr:hypothetical protein HU200_044433 [Digitaria exilis]
MPCSSLITLQV